MTPASSLSASAIQLRSRSRDLEVAARRMLERAVHQETRAERAKAGSNERRKCVARAQLLRANAELAHIQVSEIAAILEDMK